MKEKSAQRKKSHKGIPKITRIQDIIQIIWISSLHRNETHIEQEKNDVKKKNTCSRDFQWNVQIGTQHTQKGKPPVRRLNGRTDRKRGGTLYYRGIVMAQLDQVKLVQRDRDLIQSTLQMAPYSRHRSRSKVVHYREQAAIELIIHAYWNVAVKKCY